MIGPDIWTYKDSSNNNTTLRRFPSEEKPPFVVRRVDDDIFNQPQPSIQTRTHKINETKQKHPVIWSVLRPEPTKPRIRRQQSNNNTRRQPRAASMPPKSHRLTQTYEQTPQQMGRVPMKGVPPRWPSAVDLSSTLSKFYFNSTVFNDINVLYMLQYPRQKL